MHSTASVPATCSRHCRGKCLVITLIVVVVIAALVVLTFVFAPDASRSVVDKISTSAQTAVDEKLTEEQQETLHDIRRDAEALAAKVAGAIDNLEDKVYTKLGARAAYAQSVEQFMNAGAADPASLVKEGKLDERIAALDRMENVRTLSEQLRSIDGDQTRVYRTLLELLKERRDTWSVDEASREVVFTDDGVRQKYEAMQAELAQLRDAQVKVMDQIKAVMAKPLVEPPADNFTPEPAQE